MEFGFVMKRCYKCGCDFVALDERISYCEYCYLDEFEPLEYFGGDFYE